MTTYYGEGVSARPAHQSTGDRVRVRGGAVREHEVVVIDLAGSASVPGAPASDLGDRLVAAAARATAVRPSGAIAGGAIVGVVRQAAPDDGVARIETGAAMVQGYVAAGGAAVAGALLEATTIAGVGCWRAATGAVAYGRLESSAPTADGGTAPTGTALRWLELLPGGVATGIIADDAVTAAKIADGAITTAQLDPTVLRRHVRHAAYGGAVAVNTLGHIAEFTPTSPGTTYDITLGVTLAYVAAPVGNVLILGRLGDNMLNVQIAPSGAIIASVGASTVISNGSAGQFAFLAGPQRIEARFVATAGTAVTVTVTNNGTQVYTASLSSTSFGAPTNVSRVGGAFFGSARVAGAIYDWTWTDNVTPANSRRYLLDEVNGNYADSSGNGGTAATRNGTVETVAVLSADGLGRAWQGVHAPEVLRKHVRHAAYSGLGATGLNAFGTVGWAPTGSVSLQLSFHAMTTIVPAVGVYCVARLVTGYANVYIDTNGAISLRNGTTQILGSASGVIGFAGQTYAIEVNVTQTTGSIVVNGAVVAAGSFASQSWSTTTGNYYVGGGTPTAARWPGAMWNVRFADLLTANNSRRYLLDEVLGDYADSSGNGGSAMLRYGWVDTCGVLSADGLGRVWTGRPELVYAARLGADQGLTGLTASNINCNSDEIDPTNSYNTAAGTFTAPCAGLLIATIQGSLRATTLTVPRTIEARLAMAGGTRARQYIDLAAANTHYGFSLGASRQMAGGETCNGLLAGLDAADTYAIRQDSTISLVFRPN